ncbi:Mfa1 family fimbria major subunit [Segatella copri]|uniref:Mfa1 family fimbria major subunit n=2 Tax=Prevotellaceae TaxID=171552 RepID=UPI00294AF740|nr:Mfa1 family fimbria major subunit [Segatella copri]WOF98039.1 Mfa1 family fimbria major subunit [Segatella copri]
MKKMNLLVMSLVSAAALSFTSCSDSEDLANDKAGQEKVDGYYMTLTVQSPNASGTRTSVLDPTENATAEEAAIKNGTLYLVDANGDIAFHEDLSGLDWSGAVGEGESVTQKDGQKTFKIEVKNVHAGNTYKVYFKAGNQLPTAAMNFKPTLSNIFATDKKFATPFAAAENFAMFNQNDTQVDGNGYTVTFIKANNNEANPAKVNYNGVAGSPIKVERVVARIDAPVNKSTKLFAKYPENASEALKVAIDDAKDKVANIELVDYAVANLANQSYVMQTWKNNQLSLPANTNYTQKATEFGTKYYYKDNEFFNNNTVNYVFENNSSENPTTMYFEYKVTLKNEKFEGDADFKDDATNAGTFYRYNNVIYTSFDQIFKDYTGVADLFAKGMTADKMKDELKKVINDDTKLSEFRKTYNIEVFKGGKTYYKQVIKDNHIGYANAIQRNSIYRLTVNNIFNVGAQVPNGEPTENDFYYINVTVTVNPWVLNNQDVDLQ